MGRNEKIDWDAIRTEYTTTDISQKSLSDKYRVSPSTIARHSKAEKWAEERLNHRSNVRVKCKRKIANKQSDQLVKIMSLADKVRMQIEGLLEAELKDPNLLLNTRQHNRELESKVNALQKLYDLNCRYLGILEPKEAERLRLEREKFELEKRKTEQANNEDKTIRIIMDGDLDQWAE